MKFNDEQFNALAKYEGYFEKAVKAAWCPYPGHKALEEVHAILRATGDRRRLNASCGVCNLNLMRDAGRMYFKDKDERIAAENDRKAVELTKKAQAKPRKKVKIETEAE